MIPCLRVSHAKHPSSLHVQLGNLRIHQRIGVSRLDLCYLGLHKLLDNLRAATNEGLWVGERLQVWKNGSKVGCVPDAVQEVIWLALLLDNSTRLVGENAIYMVNEMIM